MVALQSLVGMILEILLVGFVIAKLLRPSKRGETILFSENAVVCKRDGRKCLMFRIGKKNTKTFFHLRKEKVTILK